MNENIPELTALDLSSQNILKSDMNGLGFSFKLDSETFSNICDTINIEYSLYQQVKGMDIST